MERGVKLGGEKIYSLAYGDDVVLLAEEEEGMKYLIARLKKYLKEKGLEVNSVRMPRKITVDWIVSAGLELEIPSSQSLTL